MTMPGAMPATRRYRVFETASGFCALAWSDVGIVRFALPVAAADEAHRGLLRRLPGAPIGTPTSHISEVIAAVRRYFTGERIDFATLRLDLPPLDDFVARIYVSARRIPWGTTTTYGALANELGAGPEGARIVGQAMAGNPVPLLIPCHRVLAAGGKLGGFSAPGGSATKLQMLALEGVRAAPRESTQQSLEF